MARARRQKDGVIDIDTPDGTDVQLLASTTPLAVDVGRLSNVHTGAAEEDEGFTSPDDSDSMGDKDDGDEEEEEEAITTPPIPSPAALPPGIVPNVTPYDDDF